MELCSTVKADWLQLKGMTLEFSSERDPFPSVLLHPRSWRDGNGEHSLCDDVQRDMLEQEGDLASLLQTYPNIFNLGGKQKQKR